MNPTLSHSTASSQDSPRTRADDDFPEVADAVRASVAVAKPPFFRVDAGDLFQTYLSGFPEHERQTFNCNACHRFIKNYGNLVTIDEEGRTRSVFWTGTFPETYKKAITNLREAVEHAPILGVFCSSEPTWGTGPTRDAKRGIDWTHFHVSSPQRFQHPLKTAHQVASEIHEEYGMLQRGLAEFPRDAVAKAKALLGTEQLYRGEKTLGVATWLLALHDRLESTKNTHYRDALMWRAVATAPPGFCHVKSSMIGTLLEDLVADLPFEEVKRRFADKMDPMQYQRAQTAPTDGNIAQAEQIIAKLKTAGSLERRFARLEDVDAIWRAPNATRPDGSNVRTRSEPGVFSHLKSENKQKNISDVGGQVIMTWVKFSRQVLPTAEKIEMEVPSRGSFIAFTTATNADAPPILQWDNYEQRNPVSWYVYRSGSNCSQWNLKPGWQTVTAVTLLPPLWFGSKISHHGEGAIFLLEGARDTHASGAGFFTEDLKSDYHPIRRTLEAYMMNAKVTGREEATACGYDLRKGTAGKEFNVRVRVTCGGLRTLYRIDRWD